MKLTYNNRTGCYTLCHSNKPNTNKLKENGLLLENFKTEKGGDLYNSKCNICFENNNYKSGCVFNNACYGREGSGTYTKSMCDGIVANETKATWCNINRNPLEDDKIRPVLLTYYKILYEEYTESDYSNYQKYYNSYGPIQYWDTSKVTNMSNALFGLRSFNQDISKWNTSKVTNMKNMFNDAFEFNQDISKWDTSNVKSMQTMFYHATSFNQDISNWNASNVKTMYGMFKVAKSFNQDISKWDIKSDTLLEGFLCDATNFGTSIKSWQFNNRFNDIGPLFTDFGYGSKLCKADQSGALYPNSDLVPDYISNGGTIKGIIFTPGEVFCG